jgi:3-phosphoshikimate 1-carboxyvinyltransferase
MDVIVATAPEPVRGARRVPASKSLHQRALLLAALSERETRLEGSASTPAGDDVRRLGAALEALGPRWVDGALGASRQRVAVDLGLGATGFRYAMAAASLRPAGAVTLVRGRPPLLARPHAVLRRALGALGGHVKRKQSGAMRVLGGGVRGRPLSVASDISSQYASALLLIAPRIGGLELTLPDRPVSRPYLALTIQVLQAFGVAVEVEGLDGPGGRITVAAAAPALEVFSVEADASCAAPWWAAAALTGGETWVEGLPAGTAQADAALLPILVRMGAQVEPGPDGTARVRGAADLRAAGAVDLVDASDLVPLVGVLAAAADGVTRIHGAGHVQHKESNRLQTVAAGIRALGGHAGVEGTDLVVRGGPLSGGIVDVAGDHRIALAFGVLGLWIPGVVLRGAEAVDKSYPAFLEDLAAAAGA